MRHLHYPHPITSETFRKPNPIVAFHSLHFLLKQLSTADDSINVDSSTYATVPVPVLRYEDIESRISFLKECAEIAWREWRLSINVKLIYRANGYAVKELLKVAKLVQKAQRGELNFDTNQASELNQKDFLEKSKTLRLLCRQLTELTPSMDEMLIHEASIQEEREDIIAKEHDSKSIREMVVKQDEEAQEMIKNLTENIQATKRDEESYLSKKKRKETELERFQKRLSRMDTFRPTFMDEFEAKQLEIQQMFEEYAIKARNLEYLERELERYREKELKIIEEKERQMEVLRQRIRDEELRMLRSGGADGAGFEFSSLNEDIGFVAGKIPDRSPMNRPQAASGIRPNGIPRPNGPFETNFGKVPVQGSMYANDEDESDEDDSSYLTEEGEDNGENGSTEEDDGSDLEESSGEGSDYTEETDETDISDDN